MSSIAPIKTIARSSDIRVPPDFMFELTKEEKIQLVTNCDRLSALKHPSIKPMVFTEQGLAMLTSALMLEKQLLRKN